MERNRGFRKTNPNSYSSRERNDFRKPWRPNANSNQQNVGINPWSQNNSQTTQNINPWQESRNSNITNPWGNDFNSNQNNWNQNSRHTNQVWSQQSSSNDKGYWRQVSSSDDQNDRESGSRQYNNLNRERRTPYDRPNQGRSNRPNREPRHEFRESRNEFRESRREFRESRHEFNERRRESSPELEPEPVALTPLEAKIERLITAVQSQPDNLGQLILLQNNNEIPPVLLNNAAHQVKNCTLVIDRNEATGYSKFRINNTVVAEGMYPTRKDAKAALYEMGLEIMKSKCFYIVSKSHYEEVSMDDLSSQKKPDELESPIDGNSKALQMMLKMGWGGKGLGNKEQGEQKSVADKIVENISREGLGGGSQTVMQEIDKILSDYAKSPKTIALGFDSGFTKEERAQIHAIAARYHLKSKSEGGFNSRRITVSKKLSKWVLVRELLSVGLENESYILTIPDDFKELWTEDE